MHRYRISLVVRTEGVINRDSLTVNLQRGRSVVATLRLTNQRRKHTQNDWSLAES